MAGMMILSILLLRAVVAARFLDDDQFGEFKENGMMSTYASLAPGRMKWEYDFVRGVLEESDVAAAKALAFSWKWCCRALLAFAFTFFAGSIVHCLIR